ncbi:hypothetical protein MIR68_004587 [Amoeboaphelidium protococcarum]|nr:hypothetical protein MIR68_004587 [Amoeboaphelidium protococcarum]
MSSHPMLEIDSDSASTADLDIIQDESGMLMGSQELVSPVSGTQQKRSMTPRGSINHTNSIGQSSRQRHYGADNVSNMASNLLPSEKRQRQIMDFNMGQPGRTKIVHQDANIFFGDLLEQK